jgi:hypothetical protein
MPVRSHAMPAVLIKVTQIELYGRERAPTDAGRGAVAPPARASKKNSWLV